MDNIPLIISQVVNQDLCVGCGACAVQSPEALSMQWSKYGFLVPLQIGNEDKEGKSIQVCPFNPNPKNTVKTEDELAEIFLKNAPNSHPRMGKLYNTYAGYSNHYRLTSSSGGIATYISRKLLEENIADYVIAVREGRNDHYEYAVIKSIEEVISSSKTKYFPVTMAEALKQVKNLDGKVAVVGIACFIKAVRLLQHYNPDFKEKIVFTTGIICGGLKSRFFAEYLAGKSGTNEQNFSKPEFRVKDYHSTASDYSYRCTDNRGVTYAVKMRSVGDMWGTGMFKNNACDFCDDVTAELADISLGDAWLSPYNMDGKGTNVVVTRSELAEKLIIQGIEKGELTAETLSLDRFLISQQGSFNHRHKGLGYRIAKATKKGAVLPPKRHDREKIPIDFQWVQSQRMFVRKESLEKWENIKNSISFDKEMSNELKKLRKLTTFYHYSRAIKRKIFGK